MWEPWIGRDYEAVRLLLLGESAYSWMQDGKEIHPSPRHSILTVDEAITDFPTTPFAIMLTRGVTRKANPSHEEREEGWARVAFTNYVAGTVGRRPRVRPSPAQWAQAKLEFPDLLRRLRPRNVIVLGKAMWSMMPDAQVLLTNDVQGYSLDARTTAFCWAVPHPSAGLSWEWLASLVDYLRR
jgi:hypothetical protein